jgi:hypothetical protein
MNHAQNAEAAAKLAPQLGGQIDAPSGVKLNASETARPYRRSDLVKSPIDKHPYFFNRLWQVRRNRGNLIQRHTPWARSKHKPQSIGAGIHGQKRIFKRGVRADFDP